MKETPVAFGPDGASLVGVVTHPTQPLDEPVVCLLLNQGAGYRIGPRRINVKLARRLAQQGIGSIRIDLSGLGDSGPTVGGAAFLQQGITDLQAAMTLAEELLGARRFLLVGLCSGGGLGMALAAADTRIAGLLMFDSWSFPGRFSVLERWVRKVLTLPFNPALRRKTAQALRQRLRKQPQIFESIPRAEQRRHFDDAMKVLHGRGVAVCMLSSASLQPVDRGRDQIGDLAGAQWAGNLEYHFRSDLDHTLATLESQRVFIDLACGWAERAAAQTPGAPHAVQRDRRAVRVAIVGGLAGVATLAGLVTE